MFFFLFASQKKKNQEKKIRSNTKKVTIKYLLNVQKNHVNCKNCQIYRFFIIIIRFHWGLFYFFSFSFHLISVTIFFRHHLHVFYSEMIACQVILIIITCLLFTTFTTMKNVFFLLAKLLFVCVFF